MILNPGVLALAVSSSLVALLLLFASAWAILILKKWDLASGSELQLSLERRTYLISAVLNWVLGFQLVSLFLYIATADRLSSLFVGAMCAAGTLQANAFGYPTLVAKIVNFLLVGVWLILNHADTRAEDYPLIRVKYWLLLVITPLVVVETVLQARFFLGLDPDLITSCCGSLFSARGRGVTADLVSFPPGPARVLFFASVAGCVALGIRRFRSGAGSYLFSVASFWTFLVSAASLISFISVAIYELPTHHCPFCIFQSGYHAIGYPLYLSLLAGAVCGLGVGALEPFRNVPSLARFLPALQRRLVVASCLCYAGFATLVAWKIAFSNLQGG